MRSVLFACILAVTVYFCSCGPAPAKDASECAEYKKCRDMWKAMGKDALPKYTEVSHPEVGEYFCAHTNQCIAERKKFCDSHKADGHELVKENCEDWEKSAYKNMK